MNKKLHSIIFIAVMAFVACKNDSKTTAASEAPTIVHKSIQKRQVDAEGKTNRMLDYLISYPSVEKGSEGLKLAVKSFSEDFVASLMRIEGDRLPLDAVMPYYLIAFRKAYAATPSIMGWSVEVKDTVLCSKPKIVSIILNGYTNFGGAHPNITSTIGNFNAATGEVINMDELIKDRAALSAMCEKKYRVAKAQAFNSGFNFDKETRFKLPNNMGFTPFGILFHYNTYEVGPYAIGDADFIIDYEELEKVMDVKKFL